jgi:hypothetical protein
MRHIYENAVLLSKITVKDFPLVADISNCAKK